MTRRRVLPRYRPATRPVLPCTGTRTTGSPCGRRTRLRAWTPSGVEARCQHHGGSAQVVAR